MQKMGRAKLKLELITKEKSRNTTFKKRKEGLIRKLRDFTTLCDVDACMIIYGPKQEHGRAEPEVWPRDPNEVKRIIQIYQSKRKESSNKTFGLSEFFQDRQKKLEDELTKLRRKNMDATYPTRSEFMNFLTESQLREFADALNAKNEYLKTRIEFLKRSKDCMDMNIMDLAHARANPSQSHNFYRPIQEMQPSFHYPTNLDHQELHQMMLLMNENDHYVQFGGASYTRQVFYGSDTGHGIMEPVIWQSPKPTARYNSPPVQMAPPPPPPSYVQYGAMPPPQVLSASKESCFGLEDVVKHHMKNGGAK